MGKNHKYAEIGCKSSTQNRLLGINSQIQDIKSLSESAHAYIDEIVTGTNNEIAIETYENELKLLSDQIKEIPEDDISKLEIKKQNLKNDITRLNRELGAIQSELEDIKTQIIALQKKLGTFSAKSGIFEALQIKSSFIDDMVKYIQKHLDDSEKNVRASVLSEVNNILTKFSRHDYKIGITSDDFKISLLDNDDNIVQAMDQFTNEFDNNSGPIKFAAQRKM